MAEKIDIQRRSFREWNSAELLVLVVVIQCDDALAAINFCTILIAFCIRRCNDRYFLSALPAIGNCVFLNRIIAIAIYFSFCRHLVTPLYQNLVPEDRIPYLSTGVQDFLIIYLYLIQSMITNVSARQK